MRAAFTFEEIRDVEKTIIEKDGIPSLILMENAGRNAFDIIRNTLPDLNDIRIFIFCGKGNNAGDGFVIARHILINGFSVNVIHVTDPGELKGDALQNYVILKSIGNESPVFCSFSEIKENSTQLKKGNVLIIDAVLGSGIKGKLTSEFETAINFINKVKKENRNSAVISIDVPSGLMSGLQVNPVISADCTITMGTIKTELLYGEGKENSGDIIIVPIGINDKLFDKYNTSGKYDVEFDDIRKLYTKRRKTSYKYSNGKALIIGGSKGLSGAVIMSALSAIKSGAGAVLAAFPESISSHFSRNLNEVIKTELKETAEGTIAGDSFEKLNKQLEKADAVLVGPGLSLNSETKSFLFDFIRNCRKNVVIDADALSLIAEDPDVLLNRQSKADIILTPHIGEFSRLCGLSADELLSERFGPVREFSRKYNVNVLMKSETSFSCLKSGEIFINSSGNESLANAGSGDVLSGIVVSLLAASSDVRTSMICGTYLHGMTADLYFLKHGNKQSASQKELINFIPKAITQILN